MANLTALANDILEYRDNPSVELAEQIGRGFLNLYKETGGSSGSNRMDGLMAYLFLEEAGIRRDDMDPRREQLFAEADALFAELGLAEGLKQYPFGHGADQQYAIEQAVEDLVTRAGQDGDHGALVEALGIAVLRGASDGIVDGIRGELTSARVIIEASASPYIETFQRAALGEGVGTAPVQSFDKPLNLDGIDFA